MKPLEEEAATAPEPRNEEDQEYPQHEPDTLEKAIEELMCQGDQRREKQRQAQKKQTTRGTVSAGAEKLKPRTETATTAMMTMKTTSHHTDPKEQTRQKAAETTRPNSANGKGNNIQSNRNQDRRNHQKRNKKNTARTRHQPTRNQKTKHAHHEPDTLGKEIGK